jgi:hypothetical protein
MNPENSTHMDTVPLSVDEAQMRMSLHRAPGALIDVPICQAETGTQWALDYLLKKNQYGHSFVYRAV